MDMEFDDILQNTTLDNPGLNNTNDEMPIVNDTIITDDFGDNSSQISFGSHIDDLYDPSIGTAHDNLIHHLKEAIEARTSEDMDFHIEHAEEARRSETFWQDAKHDAEIESQKSNIFIDGINKQLEIMDKYQKEMEDIFHRK